MDKRLEQWTYINASIKVLTAVTLAVLFGCATQSPSPPPALQTSNIYEHSGEETARNLTTAYHNTATNCGHPSTPAFLCSGVTLRITKTSDRYDPWDHSDFSRTTDAVSFSYLRADTKFARAPWNGANGFIFYPYFNAPTDKIRPEVICYFPLDGATFYRDAAGQYGCRDSIVPPFVFPTSKPCREQNVTTAEQWVAHYQSAPHSRNPTVHSCAFMVGNDLGSEAVNAFNQAIRVRSLIPTVAFGDHNELRIKAWPENQPGVLPIQAFFYLGAGLANARIDQRKYYDRTAGMVVPIIRLILPNTPSEDATFAYSVADQAVLPSHKLRPRVPKTYNAAGDRLKMSDIYTDAHVDVEVPHYTGMHATDTIRVRWQGRVNYNSGVIEVGDPPGKRLIPIPRLEVLDNIGRSVEVGYSVKEKGVGETIESARLTLHIDPQAVHPLPAPSYSNSKVSVNYGGETGYTVRVRWVGVTTHDTESQDVTSGQANIFDIPSAWVSENSGKPVLINYSIVRKNSNEQRMFSQVLRVNL